ncbi:hypothetical protein SAMN05216577_15017 [Pseudomonas citronellolis]|jgi:hypothetical protein|uniref:DUF6160 domain-containing protein n=2 Tax=Pseudomonas TaxID=286 RepID=A0A239JP48_9PSED|nr:MULTISPECIES: DUF6160 family protein [Pseudomonas]KSW22610.1 hypothetical protein AOX63_04065 [Pseudomonas sp. ADP]AMO77352.1 hypothetical protein PcP3B5_39420 [Pseudomonas citronellolis]ANI14505.1 hypothetical protein A9C11_11140 [Pseudomonas citronellolis]KES21842.1 hypothetical protein FG99_22865 [Pseudomonas sp. AAC]KRV64788.1 hypothetical protein AO742_07920 [Pseudomonas citronellolis]
MKKIKQLVLASAVLAAPFLAHADLKSMDDSALAGVTGQDGISIAGDFKASIGAVVYTDKIDDTKSGSLRLENITLTGPGGTALKIDDANPLTVDVVTTKIGTADTQQLALGLPGMTGDVSVGAIKVGDTSAASIGSLTVSNLNMAGSQVRIWGH